MAGLPNSSNALQQWHRLFEAQGGRRSEQAQQHLQQMLRLGLPTRKHENWKYTPLEGLLNAEFVSQRADITPTQRDALALNVDALRTVFVDGQFRPDLSDSTDESGYTITINDERQGLTAPVQPEVFLHLTESLAQSVTQIHVKRNQRPAKPLLLMHITRGTDGDEINTAHYRHHLELAEGAEATIIEHYVSLNDTRHFTGARLTMNVAANAQLHHIKLAFENPQSHHFAHNDILLGQDAAAYSHSFLLGARYCVTIPARSLTARTPPCASNSLAMPVKSEVCDTRTGLSTTKATATAASCTKPLSATKAARCLTV